jgi:hypothetical protein
VTAHAPGASAAGTHVVPLHSRRQARADLAQKLQHFGPAAALFFAGLKGMSGAEGFAFIIAVAELAMGLVVTALMIRAIRAHRQGQVAAHHGVDWLDIAVAGVLALEVVEHWRETHHIRRPTVLLSAVVLLQGLWHGALLERARQRTALRVDQDGIRWGRLWRKFNARWDQIASITVEPDRALIVTKRGRTRTLRLDDLANADDVRAALETARRRAASPASARTPD